MQRVKRKRETTASPLQICSETRLGPESCPLKISLGESAFPTESETWVCVTGTNMQDKGP